MKTCPNCRVIHSDEYTGTCEECGAPLGGVQANGGLGDLSSRYARQIQASSREASQETALSRGRYDGLRLEDNLMEVARAGAYLLEKSAGKDVSAWE